MQSVAALLAEARFAAQVIRQLIKARDKLKRVERQILQIHRRLRQSNRLRSRIGDAGIGRTAFMMPIRILLLPQLVPRRKERSPISALRIL